MGAYSTLAVKRSEAIDVIKSHIDNIDKLSNDQLSELLYCLVGGEKTLHNFWVFNDEETREENFDSIADMYFETFEYFHGNSK